MKKLIFLPILFLLSSSAKADFFGGDLPLLLEIVTNTLNTLNELEDQTTLMRAQMEGITSRIHRIQTIAETVQPSTWNQWKNPAEAIRRLRTIYYTLPDEYRSPKADAIESELSQAMNLIGRLAPEADTTFKSGKEMERRATYSSPGVAEKLTASGVGTLIAIESQTQIIQSHITSLLAQMLADANEKESRSVVTRGTAFSNVSENLGPHDGLFSSHAFLMGLRR